MLIKVLYPLSLTIFTVDLLGEGGSPTMLVSVCQWRYGMGRLIAQILYYNIMLYTSKFL